MLAAPFAAPKFNAAVGDALSATQQQVVNKAMDNLDTRSLAREMEDTRVQI
jgi:hypothetical protein